VIPVVSANPLPIARNVRVGGRERSGRGSEHERYTDRTIMEGPRRRVVVESECGYALCRTAPGPAVAIPLVKSGEVTCTGCSWLVGR